MDESLTERVASALGRRPVASRPPERHGYTHAEHWIAGVRERDDGLPVCSSRI